MGYKDIILLVLRKRKSVICREDHLISDFENAMSPFDSIMEWCNENQIIYKKLSKNMVKLKMTKLA